MSATTFNITPQRGFEILCAKLQSAGPEAQKRVAAHMRAITGKHTPLPLYHADKNIEDKDKLGTYSLLVKAILNNDYSLLQGNIGAGDRRVDPVDEAAPAAAPAQPAKAAEPAPAPAPRQTKVEVVAPEPPSLDASRMSPVARAILDEITPFLPKRDEKPASISEEEVKALVQKALPDPDKLEESFKEIAEQVFKTEINNGGLPVERIQKLIDERVAGQVNRIEFASQDGTFKPIEGLMHPQVTQIATWLRAVGCCWAWGGAGSGKTHMARQIAALLEVDPYVWSVDPTTTVAKIMGYRNVANGDFVEGFTYRAFKNGGLSAADEMDTGDSGVMAAANALLSNSHYMFPNGETVARNERFYFLALANSRGMGATAGYVARNRLDAATLDRFPVVEVKYDAGLESALSCGVGMPAAPWKPGKPADQATQKSYVDWVQKVRQFAGNSVLISPRASINGCKALRAGISMPEVVDALVLKLVTEDSVARIKDKCGLPY